MAQMDRDALVALYNATGGAKWRKNWNWNTDADLSQWHGVKVDTQGRVVELSLGYNNLRGPIPPELGKLAALELLYLFENKLSGHIPPQLGQLGVLQYLSLGNNELDGHIPPQLGDLGALRYLRLDNNKLDGHIPPQLGQLGVLQFLSLANNELDGPIPPGLGKLTALKELDLSENQLTGHIPPQLGQLGALQYLILSRNKLDGPIPPELGKLAALKELYLWRNQLSGGPGEDESLEAWRTRLQSELAEQEHAEQERTEQERAGQSRAEERAGLERGGTDAAPVGDSSSSGGGGSEDRFRVQVASFADLNELTRENRETLEEVKRLLGQPAAADTLPSGAELTCQLGELDSLIGMAKTLDDMTSRYTADLDLQKKEMSLEPSRKAYNVAVRSGLCNAYLAASVVCSGLVSTSKVGVMGKAGTALKLISGSVPLVGGLAGFAGAALKAGDSIIQTRRLEKITDLAPDALECSTLARSLALRLTDGLTDGTIAVTCDAIEHLTRYTAGVGWDAGGSKSSLGSGALIDGVNEEAVMEWFIDGISDCGPGDGGATAETRELQAGRRLGKRHLRMLLTAVGRDCLRGTNSTREKVDTLLQIVLPEANIRPTATLSAGEDPRMRPPVRAPADDTGLDQAAELARLMANVETQQAEMAKQREEMAKQRAEIEKQRETIEKRLPKPHAAPGGSVDAGGGLVFAQKQQQRTETQEDFNEGMENPAHAADRQTVTPSELREIEGRVDDLGRETGYLGAELAALRENRGKNKGLRRFWRGNR